MIQISGLNRITRDNFIQLVCAMINGRMANIDMRGINNEWDRSNVIEESFKDVMTKLSEAGITIELPEENDAVRQLLSELLRVHDVPTSQS